MPSTDLLPTALAQLDPARRATLALLARRGLGVERVATLLGTDPSDVEERRRDALEALAAEVGASPEETWRELLVMPADRWPGARAAEPEPEPRGEPEPEEVALEAEPEPEPQPEPETEPQLEPEPIAAAPVVAAPREEPDGSREPRRRRTGVLVGGAAVAVAAVVVVVALTSGGDGSSAKAPDRREVAATSTTPPVATTPPTASAPGTPVAGSEAAVGADGRTVRLHVSGLPAGRYEAWLYDSILDARSLGVLRPDGTLEARLPAGARGYELLDVSRQPAGLGRHSGQSVVRVPTRELAPGATVALSAPPL